MIPAAPPRRFRLTSAMLAVAAFGLVATPLSAEDTPRQQTAPSATSDAEIDAILFRDIEGQPGSGDIRRLVSEIEPERWALAREVVRRALETRDDAKRAALIAKVGTVEAAAQAKAMSRLAVAPLASLDAVGLAMSRLLVDLERRDPLACVGYAWPNDAAAAARFAALPFEATQPLRIESLRAARAARSAPAAYPPVDEALWARVRDGLRAWGATSEELAAQAAEQRPKDLDDGQLCRLLGRLSIAALRLPEDLRGPALAYRFQIDVGPDPTAADAERLARMSAMTDAEIDAMLFAERPDRPGVGAALRMASEIEPDAWRRLTSPLRAEFRPIDDGEVSATAGEFAFRFVGIELKRGLATAPTERLESVARALIDALKALGQRDNGLCARAGYWLAPGDGSIAHEMIPDEALALVRATAEALAAARGAPVERAPFDATSGPQFLAALEQAGFAPPAYTGPGDVIPRPPDTEDGWCRFRARYVEALLRLPDEFRGQALADELSAEVDEE